MPYPKYRELIPYKRRASEGIRALERKYGNKTDTVYVGTDPFKYESYTAGNTPASLRRVKSQYTVDTYPYQGISKEDSIKYERDYNDLEELINSTTKDYLIKEIGEDGYDEMSEEELTEATRQMFSLIKENVNSLPSFSKYKHIINTYNQNDNIKNQIQEHLNTALWADNPNRRRYTADFNEGMNDISNALAIGAVSTTPLIYTGYGASIPGGLATASAATSAIKGLVGMGQSVYDMIVPTKHSSPKTNMMWDGIGAIGDASIAKFGLSKAFKPIASTALHQVLQNTSEKALLDPNSSTSDINIALGANALTTGVPFVKSLANGAKVLRTAKRVPKVLERARNIHGNIPFYSAPFPAVANGVSTGLTGGLLYLNNTPNDSNKMQGGGFLDKATSVASGALGVLNNAVSMAGIADTSKVESDINMQNNKQVASNTNNSLLNEWTNHSDISHVTYDQVRGNGGNPLNFIGGIAQGAMGGAAFGPIGAAIGGGIGLIGSAIGGIFGSNKARRKMNELNSRIDDANRQAQYNFQSKANSIENLNDSNLFKNFFNKGGTLI